MTDRWVLVRVDDLAGMYPDGLPPIPREVVEGIARVIGYHFAALVSRNNQPVMSGDPRDRLLPHIRRQFEDAEQEAARAVIHALGQKVEGDE